MTAQLQQAIQMVRSLSPNEQAELLQVLAEMVQKSSLLQKQNQEFWHARSIEQLIQEQQPPVIQDLTSLDTDFWDSDEPVDEFLTFLRQQRSIDPLETL